MEWIDTHAHLDFAEFDDDRGKLIKTLADQKIGVINPATDEASVAKIDKLTRENSLVWGAVGLHPTDITSETTTRLPGVLKDWSKMIAANPRLVAVGEVGLDYYHKRDSAHQQKIALRQMITFAIDHDLPVIFHCRDAYGDLGTILDNYPGLRGVVHCFSGSSTQASQFLEAGLNLSFTCNVTYDKNDELRQVITTTPLEKIMIETDSPFLAPQDRRGERNDPTQVVEVAKVIAAQKKVTIETVARQTTANAQKLFKIGE